MKERVVIFLLTGLLLLVYLTKLAGYFFDGIEGIFALFWFIITLKVSILGVWGLIRFSKTRDHVFIKRFSILIIFIEAILFFTEGVFAIGAGVAILITATILLMAVSKNEKSLKTETENN